jgi:hypothetical protein
MNLRVRILASVVVAMLPVSTLLLHAQRTASLSDIAMDGTDQSSASSPAVPSAREPGRTPPQKEVALTQTLVSAATFWR